MFFNKHPIAPALMMLHHCLLFGSEISKKYFNYKSIIYVFLDFDEKTELVYAEIMATFKKLISRTKRLTQFAKKIIAKCGLIKFDVCKRSRFGWRKNNQECQ